MHRNGSVVGHVTAGAWSPFLERGIGYIRMREPGEWTGTEVRLADDDSFEVVKLPFYDAEKAIPRGLTT